MKKTIYILAPYPRGEAPSQRFRFEQYLSELEKDYEILFHPFIDVKTWKTLYAEGNVFPKVMGMLRSFLRRWALLFKLRKADFIFIHREAAQLGPPIFEWIIAKILRKKYIYDFDDAIWLPNYSESNARFHRLKAYWKVRYCMKWAHQITAGNNYLKNFALQYNPNVKVVPTTIDTVNYHNITTDYSKKELIIGWTGTHTTMHYLNELVPVLKRLEEKNSFTFVVISNQSPDFELKSLRFVQWNKNTEIEDLARFSIGVMPLKPDIWSSGKCGFKGLQYMSLGIPTIMSPVGVNTEIVTHNENGFLASTEAEWEIILEKLLENPEYRKEIGQKGQKTIQQRYSVLSQMPVYKSLFNQ